MVLIDKKIWSGVPEDGVVLDPSPLHYADLSCFLLKVGGDIQIFHFFCGFLDGNFHSSLSLICRALTARRTSTHAQ